MRIRITDLPQPTQATPGLQIIEDLDLDALNKRLNEGKNNQFTFTVAPHVELTFVAIGSTSAEVSGTINTKYIQECGLCLDPVERSATLPMQFQIRPTSNSSENKIDEIGILYYEGEHAELDEWLQSEIILSLSLYWHPPFSEDQCSICKKNKSSIGIYNEEVKGTLGDFFKDKLK